MKETRVRFAPSPTGFLHIGGARTSLFNFLFARATGGKFLLRIEDTDRERSEDRFTADIMESLKWLGMEWDEEPIYQSKRFGRYHEVIEGLIQKGLAYRCECTPQELDALRKQYEQEKKPFRYPGTCRNKTNVGEKSVVRIKTPDTGETGFTDLIRGEITFANKDVDDWVVMRTDKAPTYNFSCVIDDSDQGITHVLRGDDHINNTPKQILLYQTLGLPVPNFAHLPMILGADRQKLSKRHGAASTLEYRTMGYLPEALVNFLVRLGWSHGDQEIFTMEELRKFFSLDHIGKANAVFNTDKLNWISGHWFRETPAEKLCAYLKKYFVKEMEKYAGIEEKRMVRGIQIIQAKVKLIPELLEQLDCVFGEDPSYDMSKFKPEDKTRIKETLNRFMPLMKTSDFSHEILEKAVKDEVGKTGGKFGPIAQAFRFAVTGGRISPGLFEMLEVQGRETVLRRMERALSVL